MNRDLTDFWDNRINVIDSSSNINDTFINGLYYYLVDDFANADFIGNCSALTNIVFSPFLSSKNLNVKQVLYDKERFGKIQGSTINRNITLKRIQELLDFEYELGKVDIYTKNPNYSYVHYKNESRLQNFPYQKGYIYDYINPPIEIEYHKCFGLLDYKKNKLPIMCKSFLSDKMTYMLYAKDYLNDQYGNLEGIKSSTPLDLPLSSSAYSQWSSTQKAQDLNNTRNAIMNSGLNANINDMNYNLNSTLNNINTIANVGGSALSLNGGGVFKGIMQGGINKAQNNLSHKINQMQNNLVKTQALGNKNAKQKDLDNTPNSIVNSGSDIAFNLLNGNRSVEFVKYGINTYYANRLCSYFTMYGYKQNKLMPIDINSRLDFNYMRTLGCNIKSKSNKSVPMKHLNKLKEIFDNGVTIWHIDRNGNRFLDYDRDNKEVNLYSIKDHRKRGY